MTDQPYPPANVRRPVRPMPQVAAQPAEVIRTRETERKVGLWASIDKPLLVIVALLLTIGSGMVFSTTWDWSLQDYGSSTAIFFNEHLRNLAFGIVGLTVFALIDYRFWKRFTPILLLGTFGALVAVALFGEFAFGARRSLIGGRFQPSELAEFTLVVYMAAWLGAKNTKVGHLIFGLLPFGIIVSMLTLPVVAQPDLSSAAVIGLTAVTMYFLAGARLWHLGMAFFIAAALGLFFVQSQPYAQSRLASYTASLTNPLSDQTSWHTQQAIIAFVNGGWFGRGLGQSEQKFGFLPAPHTDSIFAVIGEELGVVGATFVVLLFVAFVIRGFQISRRAVDPFGALLAAGFTMWVAIQALLNIAVMTAVIPSSGLPLPFISYGGSALLVLMVGVGMMLSVSRVATLRENNPNRSKSSETNDRRWRDGRTRLSRTSRRRSAVTARYRR